VLLHATIAAGKIRSGKNLKIRPYPLALLLLALTSCAQNDKTEIALINPGFEDASPTAGEIRGWATAQHAGPVSYEMTVDTDVHSQGRTSFRITRKREQVYGQIAQVVPIAAYVGRTIELSAQMKTDDVGADGWQLMLTFTGGVLNSRHTAAPLTGTQGFREVTIRTPVPAGAQEAEIAAILHDRGSVWLDDVRLRVLD